MENAQLQEPLDKDSNIVLEERTLKINNNNRIDHYFFFAETKSSSLFKFRTRTIKFDLPD